MAVQIANNPAGYLNNIKTLTSSLASDSALLGQLVSSLPQTIKDEQELENPYSSDSSLHATFADGVYRLHCRPVVHNVGLWRGR